MKMFKLILLFILINTIYSYQSTEQIIEKVIDTKVQYEGDVRIKEVQNSIIEITNGKITIEKGTIKELVLNNAFIHIENENLVIIDKVIRNNENIYNNQINKLNKLNNFITINNNDNNDLNNRNDQKLKSIENNENNNENKNNYNNEKEEKIETFTITNEIYQNQLKQQQMNSNQNNYKSSTLKSAAIFPLSRNMRIDIQGDGFHIIFETTNEITLSLPTMKCTNFIYVNPTDYKTVTINVETLTSGCQNKVLVQSSIPINLQASGSAAGNVKLNCGLHAITTSDFENTYSKSTYDYDSFYNYANQATNTCPPSLCIPTTAMKIDQGKISFKCSNIDDYADDGKSIYVKENTYLGGSFNDVILTDKISLVSWCGIQTESNKYNVVESTNLRTSAGAKLKANQLVFKSTKYYGVAANLELASSELHVENELIIENLTLSETSSVKVVSSEIYYLTISSTSLFTSDHLKGYYISFVINWSDALDQPMINTKGLEISDDSVEWIILDNSYKTNPSVPLIYSEVEMAMKVPSSTFLHCTNNVLYSSGTSNKDGLKCAFFETFDECVLIQSDANDPNSYDMTTSTAPKCPCSSTDQLGCTIIVQTNKVTGNINANTLSIKTATSLDVNDIVVTDNMYVYANTSLKFKTQSINVIQISDEKELKLEESYHLKKIKGKGTIRSDKKTTIDSIEGVKLYISQVDITTLFSPSYVYVDNSVITLLENCKMYAEIIYFEYIKQNGPVIFSQTTKSVIIYYLRLVSFPLQTCVELFKIETVPEGLSIYSMTPNTHTIELACNQLFIIICNSPPYPYDCGDFYCVVTHPEYPVTSTKAYDSVDCPCGLNDNYQSYLINNCTIIAHNVSVFTNMKGNFWTIETDDNVQFELIGDFAIHHYEPVKNQTFITTKNKPTLTLNATYKDNYQMKFDMPSNLSVSFDTLTIETTQNCTFEEMNGKKLIMKTSADILLPNATYGTMDYDITYSDNTTRMIIPTDFNANTMILRGNNFSQPFFVMEENKVITMKQFEYIGEGSGVFVQKENVDTIQINRVINAYVNELNSYIATEDVPKEAMICEYWNNKWNYPSCPCSGDHCILKIGSSSYNKPIENIRSLYVYEDCHFTQHVNVSYVEVHSNVTFDKCTIKTLMIKAKDLTSIVNLKEFNIELINKTSPDYLVVNATEQGFVGKIDCHILHLMTYKPFDFNDIHSKFLILYQRSDKPIIQTTNGTLHSDNSIQILVNSVDDNFVLQTNGLPPLDDIVLYQNKPNGTQKVSDVYMTFECGNYLYIDQHMKHPNCPSNPQQIQDQNKNENNQSKPQLQYLWFLSIGVVVIIAIVIVIVAIVLKKKQPSSRDDSFFMH